MQFKSSTIILVLGMAHGLIASPVEAGETTNRPELYREDTKSGGTLVYYGDTSVGASAKKRSEAAPVEAGEVTNRPELFREKTKSGGSLVYYGEPTDGTPLKRRFEARSPWLWWGSNDKCPDEFDGIKDNLKCDKDRHTAANGLCDELVNEMWGHSDIQVEHDARQICYVQGKKDACCVSWHVKLPDNLTKGDLAKHANSIMERCTTNGISGKIGSVNILGTCTAVCLSNRGTGC